MEKIMKQVPVKVEQMQEKEIFVTADGREFEREEDALVHETLNLINQIDISDYFPAYNKQIKLVYFEDETQVELYEQLHSGNADDNTWMSWLSHAHKHKFENLPKWVVCHFENHGNDYTAFYYTLDEFKDNLRKVLTVVDMC
ncbi:hypothetical protein [Paenibacillus cremeus]|uniref:Uncharacterized protein n=1 Tax=Paenibacillus cremeus TaxID=2163881 RepID=A0A559KCK1_9BACL|nr:hypothetical protein [Paenibacillus cremeus]TVY09866.1 hypothetical protein FPZ49_10870 [Paenibacillus cremeus]